MTGSCDGPILCSTGYIRAGGRRRLFRLAAILDWNDQRLAAIERATSAALMPSNARP
jgi:hypothetical protein